MALLQFRLPLHLSLLSWNFLHPSGILLMFLGLPSAPLETDPYLQEPSANSQQLQSWGDNHSHIDPHDHVDSIDPRLLDLRLNPSHTGQNSYAPGAEPMQDPNLHPLSLEYAEFHPPSSPMLDQSFQIAINSDNDRSLTNILHTSEPGDSEFVCEFCPLSFPRLYLLKSVFQSIPSWRELD
jgi:hypothetical protein